MISPLHKVSLALLFVSCFFLASCSSDEETRGLFVALGDSITVGTNPEGSSITPYPQIMGHEMDMEVQNLAVSGWETAHVNEALRTDEDYRQAIREATLIAVTIGGNDLLRILRRAGLESGGDPVLFEENIVSELDSGTLTDAVSEILMEIRSISDAPVLLYNIYNPFVSGDPLHRLGSALLPAVNLALEEVAGDYPDVYIGDVYAAYDGNQERFIIPDDIHPSEDGHEMLAEIGLKLFELP